MTHSSHLLRQILVKIEEFQNQGQQSLAVFDLDSTLFDVSPRVERILLEFAADPVNQKRFPEQIPLLKDIRTYRKDWGFQNALQRAGLDGHHPELQEAVRDFWYTRFFSNEYLQYDLPYDGAVEYVNACANLGAEVVYLTGRDVHRMGSGSALTMKRWGFPLDDRQTRLVLKPHKSMDDAEFKTDWFAALPEKQYADVWFFENEPVNIHHLRAQLPHVNVVFFESTHAGKAAPPEDIPKIMHFLLDEQGDN
ncbi:HAD family hydrolase [Bdellovibrio sp. HCB337]|uniref:HAD family hydrolase n=1 Tax=Bdellovibrio sp. HCB337 TaxID=3394358 RepID=UPI0039A4AB40